MQVRGEAAELEGVDVSGAVGVEEESAGRRHVADLVWGSWPVAVVAEIVGGVVVGDDGGGVGVVGQ